MLFLYYRPLAAERTDGDSAELELDAPMDIVDVDSEKVETEPEVMPSVEVVAPESISLPPSTTSEVKEVQEEVIIPGLDLVSEGQQKQDQLWMAAADTITEVSMIAMPPSRDEEEVDAQIMLVKISIKFFDIWVTKNYNNITPSTVESYFGFLEKDNCIVT